MKRTFKMQTQLSFEIYKDPYRYFLRMDGFSCVCLVFSPYQNLDVLADEFLTVGTLSSSCVSSSGPGAA